MLPPFVTNQRNAGITIIMLGGFYHFYAVEHIKMADDENSTRLFAISEYLYKHACGRA